MLADFLVVLLERDAHRVAIAQLAPDEGDKGLGGLAMTKDEQNPHQRQRV